MSPLERSGLGPGRKVEIRLEDRMNGDESMKPLYAGVSRPLSSMLNRIFSD